MSGTGSEHDPHQRLRELLGAHALGHLGPGEDAALRAHLDGCAACRAELAEIAPLREALAGVDPDRLASPPSPPPGLGEEVRRRVAAERAEQRGDDLARRRSDRAAGTARRARGVAVAAAAVLVVGAGGLLLGRATAPAPPAVPYEAVALQVVGEDDVVVDEAGLVPHTWGVELRVRASGFDRGEVYRAAFVDEAGRSTPAGEFLGTGAQEMVCNLQAALLRDDAARVVVTDADGSTVLEADI